MDDDGRWWTHGRSSGRVRNAVTCSSRCGGISDTIDFDRPVIPRVRTNLSSGDGHHEQESLSTAGDLENLLAFDASLARC